MGRTRRNKTSGTKPCVCDRCGMEEPSTVQGTKHRRCGGGQGVARKPKHTRVDVKGVWR